MNARNVSYEIIRIDYDPNRSSLLALCKTLTPQPFSHTIDAVSIDHYKYFYRLAIDNLTVGSIIHPLQHKIGNTLPLHSITIGTEICNIDSKFCRSAGTFATILDKFADSHLISLKLSSGAIKLLPDHLLATIGRISNPQHNQQHKGKAGVNR
jgi:large subunit ribosomal protein L2